jgi:DNA-binding response OmpR family regulator
MWNPFKHKQLSDYNPNLSRQELIRRSRILVIDDEQPKLIEDLRKDGFSVDYDPTGNDTTNIEKNLYDLIILDFGGVGEKFGRDQGLSLLRHIKRVNPAPFILAYTSKSLPATQADFYRLTNGTLSKDAGIQESFLKIEDSLREALNVERLWTAVLQLALKNPEDRADLQETLLKCLKKKKFDSLYAKLAHHVGEAIKENLVGFLVQKLIGLAITGGTTP